MARTMFSQDLDASVGIEVLHIVREFGATSCFKLIWRSSSSMLESCTILRLSTVTAIWGNGNGISDSSRTQGFELDLIRT